MPLKILITTFTYPPNADGVAEATAVLAQGLARQGHAVTVATEFHPQRKPNAPDANPRVEQFKITGNSNWRIGIRGETDAYQKFLSRLRLPHLETPSQISVGSWAMDGRLAVVVEDAVSDAQIPSGRVSESASRLGPFF